MSMRIVLLQASCAFCRVQNRLVISAKNSVNPKCGSCHQPLFSKFAVIFGCVYILSNPSMRGLVKIGQTRGELQVRVDQLSPATAVPSPFSIEAYFLSKHPKEEEAELHLSLKEHRHRSGREFFSLGVDNAISRCQKTLGRDPDYVRGINGKFREP